MNYLFDTSSLLIQIEEEEGWQNVEPLLMSGEGAVCFISLTELYYRLKPYHSEYARKGFDQFFLFPLKILWADQSMVERAGFLKAEYGLGLADAFVAASADLNRLTLVHRDKDFLPLKHIKQKYLR